MKKLDWYIIKKFLGTFFFIILAFIVISVVIDLSEQVDDFIRHNAPLDKTITGYYLNFCIHFGNLLSGILIFLTVVWVSSNMAQKSEVVAILSGGISFNRFLRPFMIAATALVLVALAVSHVILPRANKKKMEFTSKYLRPDYYINDRNMHRQISDNQIAYFKSVSAGKMRGNKFSLETWQNGMLLNKLGAETATFQPDDSTWVLKKGYERTFKLDGTEQTFREFNKLDTALNLTISDFGYRNNISGTMTWTELNQFIAELERKGFSQITEHQIEKHQRTSIPFSIYVFVLIAVAIASRKLRGGTGIHLILAVVIGFAYVFFQKIAAVSATNSGVPPIVAVWIPNILFFILGLYLYKRAPK